MKMLCQAHIVYRHCMPSWTMIHHCNLYIVKHQNQTNTFPKGML